MWLHHTTEKSTGQFLLRTFFHAWILTPSGSKKEVHPFAYDKKLLEHTELSTTLGYIHNPSPEKDTYELISKAL